jgi:hypothetical protein
VNRPTIAPADAAGSPSAPGTSGGVGIVEGEPGRYRVSRALEAVALEAVKQNGDALQFVDKRLFDDADENQAA